MQVKRVIEFCDEDIRDVLLEKAKAIVGQEDKNIGSASIELRATEGSGDNCKMSATVTYNRGN